ncbi:MAG: ATP-binding cassette domain-containing protein [Verrucomicrobiae bacterium]|nr:ATP-binding cassette domain-containing protein [Verrucomicrobiae bacterium]
MSTPAVIELVGARIAWEPDAEPVLTGVTWQVQAGDFWILSGLHGSGKSLLLETLAGIRPCAGGELRWFGQLVAGGTGPATGRGPLRRRVGMVFDGGGRMFGQLSVAENIALPVSYHDGLRMDEAVEATAPLRAALALDRLAAAPAGRIGRAWMQRVALGRALALGPEVLLLDNPTAGMDPDHARWWRQFLTALAAGHAPVSTRPITLVTTVDEAQPWAGLGRQFAEVGDHRLRTLNPGNSGDRGSGG